MTFMAQVGHLPALMPGRAVKIMRMTHIPIQIKTIYTCQPVQLNMHDQALWHKVWTELQFSLFDYLSYKRVGFQRKRQPDMIPYMQ